jgi:hypothetical protein
MSRATTSILLIGMGLTGLFLHIDYSGWVLFFGLMAIP